MKKSEIQLFNREKHLAIFDEKIEITELCKGFSSCGPALRQSERRTLFLGLSFLSFRLFDMLFSYTLASWFLQHFLQRRDFFDIFASRQGAFCAFTFPCLFRRNDISGGPCRGAPTGVSRVPTGVSPPRRAQSFKKKEKREKINLALRRWLATGTPRSWRPSWRTPCTCRSRECWQLWKKWGRTVPQASCYVSVNSKLERIFHIFS